MRSTTKILLIVFVISLLIPGLYKATTRINDRVYKQATVIESYLYKLKSIISEQPVSGQIHGQEFHMERAELDMKRNTLILREGEGYSPDRAVIVDFSVKEIPEGKQFLYKIVPTGKYSKNIISFGKMPDIDISWKRPRSKFSSTDFLMDNNYDFFLELDHITGDRISGKIYLQVHDQYKSQVQGAFIARVTNHGGSLKITNLTSDSVDTFEYLIRKYLTEKYPQDTIDISDFVGGSFIKRGKDDYRQGYMMVLFTVNGGENQSMRFQFSKNENGWYIANTLRGNQLVEAHPWPPYTPNTSSDYCRYITAQRIEKYVENNYPNDYIKIFDFTDGRENTNYPRATVKLSYLLSSGQKYEHHYYCEKKGEEWIIAKEIGANEYVDFERGRIFERKRFTTD